MGARTNESRAPTQKTPETFFVTSPPAPYSQTSRHRTGGRTGCALRVVSQVLAYEHIATVAWRVLPLSAGFEMAAVTLFALNMLTTPMTTGSPLEASPESRRAGEAASA